MPQVVCRKQAPPILGTLIGHRKVRNMFPVVCVLGVSVSRLLLRNSMWFRAILQFLWFVSMPLSADPLVLPGFTTVRILFVLILSERFPRTLPFVIWIRRPLTASTLPSLPSEPSDAGEAS